MVVRWPLLPRHPSFKLAADQRAKQGDARLAVVETGETGEIRTAGGKESFAAAYGKLLERLQTIRGKAWGENGDPGHTLAGKAGQHPVGGGLEPFRAAQATLARD